MSQRTDARGEVQKANKVAAVRFIHGFNDDDWDAVREVVGPEQTRGPMKAAAHSEPLVRHRRRAEHHEFPGTLAPTTSVTCPQD